MDAKLPDAPGASIAERLLPWYDRHARTLPWRARGGEAVDPYRVWLSEVMLQQTTVAAVAPRFETWVARWPDLASLAAADDADVMAAWAGLGYYARARNLLKTARIVAAGGWPDDEAGLRALPGLGAYTAAAIAAIAFGRRAVVIDANVERVVARLFALTTTGTALRAAADRITPEARAGDFAQAMMDLGATICTPRSPRCLLCPLAGECRGYASGTPEAFAAAKVKTAKPQRYGTIFWLERDGKVLLVRRPATGLLGGMRALPTGPWSDAPPGLADAPADADWRIRDRRARHAFTHFRLELALAVGAAASHSAAGEWWPIAALDEAGLPTVFAKAARAVIEGDNET